VNSYYKEATVGLLVLLGITAFVLGTMWLRGRTIGSRELVLVTYADVRTLKEGAPVRVSGAVVGTVEQIELQGMGRVVVGFTFDDEKVSPRRDAAAQLVSVGMLGDMAIDFDPGKGEPMTEADTLVGTVAPGLFDIGEEVAAKASAALTSLNQMLDTSLVVDLRRALVSTERLMSYLGDRKAGPTAEVAATMRSLQSVSARLDSTLAAIDAGGLQARVDSTMRSAGALTDRLAEVSTRMNTLLGRIERGEGTLGQMMADSGLYVDLRRTLQSASALIDSLARNPEKVGITVKMF
jgi:phospholipid/cholesterol/gamma-HCH transport system substrate-binding protein